MKNPINVLLVEDNEGDAELLKRMLKKGDYVAQCRRVETEEAFVGALDEQAWDLILCDYRLPGFSGIEALRMYKKRELDIPFIFVSGTMGEEIAVDAMTKGAHDYVMKNNLMRLLPAIDRELKEAKVRIERRQAVEALRTSEAYYKTLTEASPDALVVVDTSGAVAFASPKTLEMFGIPPEAMVIGTSLLNWVSPDDHEIIKSRLQAILSHRSPGAQREIRLLKNDQTQFWGDINSSPIVDENANVVGVLIVCRDISDRKRVEESLRESEEKFRNLFNNSEVGMFRTRLDGSEILDFNEKYLKILNYTLEEVKGLPSMNLWADKRERDNMVQLLKAQGHVTDFECGLLNRQGEVRKCITSLRLYRDKGILEGSIQDITERKLAEEALRQSEARYRSVLQSANDAIVTADSSGNISGWNKGAERIFGYTYVEAVGQSLIRLMPEGFSVDPTNELKSLQPGGGLHIAGKTIEVNGVRKDGTEFPIELSLATWEVSESHFYTAIIRDITERKRAEAAERESELRFRSVWNNSADGMRLTDRDGRILDLNVAFCKLVKIPREELLGQIFSVTYRREGPSDDLSLYQKRFDASETIASIRSTATLRSGETIDLEVTSSFIEIAGQKKMLLSLFRDVTERNKAEKRLEEERNLLRTIIDAIPDEIAVKDTERRFIVVNSGTVNAFKRASQDEIIGKRDEDLIPEHLVKQAMWEENAVLAVGGHTQNRVADKTDPQTGEIERSLLTSKIPIKDDAGKIIGLVCINRDVTELKRIEEMLQKERTLLLTLIESIPDEVCLKDLRHRYIVANGASIKALGVSSLEALIGKSDWDLVPRNLAEQHQAEEKAIIETGKPLINREQIKIDPVSGETEKCALTTKVPVRDQTGKTIGILVVNRNITDRKRAEEGLRASEGKYRALFEESKDCIYISSGDGTLLDINAAGIEMFGYGSKEELLRLELGSDLYVDSQRREEFLSRMNQQGFVKDFEATMKRKEGQKLNVLETATAVLDKHGTIVMYRGTIRDVTRQRQLEMQVGQAQKMESLGLLAGGIAHDFNNILGIILGHTAIVERAGDKPELLKDSVNEITTAVQRGASLVRQILTFARKSDAEDEPIRVNATVKELGKMISDTFPKTISLLLNLDKTIPIIMMDQTQLHQALLNLCVNARDAITDATTGKLGRGEIRIQTSVISNSEVRKKFSEASAREYVCIAVSDSGKGMDEETKQKIFEPFFTTKERDKGTGLGLSVVYGIIKSHHGHIEVESEIGRGTTFRLYLPVADVVATPVAPRDDGTQTDVRGKETILLVEDEQNLLGLMKTALERAGYTVLTAMDGLSAIKTFSLNKEKIALVLTDLGLPKLDGAAVFTSLMEIDPNVKIILASGYLDPNLKSNMLRSGAKEFIQKPYSPGLVLKTIRAVLDGPP